MKKIQKIAIIAIMVALIISLKQFTMSLPVIGRFELTHLIIIIVGLINGPIVAGAVGFFGDFLGGLVRGFTPFPIIFPFGYALVGVLAGFLKKYANNKKLLIIGIILLFFVTNYIIEYVTYVIFFVFTIKKYTFEQSLLVYFGSRVWRIFWQLPIWLLVVVPAYNQIKGKKYYD